MLCGRTTESWRAPPKAGPVHEAAAAAAVHAPKTAAVETPNAAAAPKAPLVEAPTATEAPKACVACDACPNAPARTLSD